MAFRTLQVSSSDVIQIVWTVCHRVIFISLKLFCITGPGIDLDFLLPRILILTDYFRVPGQSACLFEGQAQLGARVVN